MDAKLTASDFDEDTFVGEAIRGIGHDTEHYQAIFEQLGVGVGHTNLEGRFLEANPKLCDILACTQPEALALTIGDVTHRDDIDKLIDVRTQLLAGKAAHHDVEARFIRKDGSEVWTSIATSLISAADGAPLHFISLIRDISEQKRAQDIHRETELRFRQLADNIREVFFLINAANTKMLYVSPAHEMIFGQPIASLYEDVSAWTKMVHPDDLPATMAAIAQLQVTGGMDHDYRIVRPDHSVRWINARAFPIRDEAGQISRFAGIAEDITERKRVTEELRESERRFSDMLRYLDLVAVMLDTDSRITYCNDYFLRLTGWTGAEVIGRSWFELFVPADFAEMRRNLQASLLADQPSARNYESEILTRAGGRRVIAWNNTVLRSPAGQVVGSASIGEDVTESKRNEAQVKLHAERIQRAMYSTIDVIAAIGALRDPYTHGHEHQVGEIAGAIAAEMGLDANFVEGVRIAGYLHDVGKIRVPAEILSKPSRLTPEEYNLIKTHAQTGYEILKGIDFPWPVAEIARQHHERIDGSGYPQGLKGEQILLEARIIAVADTVEAMAAHRPYRPGLGLESALAEIEKHSGKLFAPEVVEACLRLFRTKRYQLPTSKLP